MPRQRKIKTVRAPIFTSVGVVFYDRPTNLPASEHVAAVSANNIIVARSEYAELLHLRADKMRDFASRISQVVSTDECSAGPVVAVAPRKRSNKAPAEALTKLVNKVRSFNHRNETPKDRKIRLVALAEKARLRRAAAKSKSAK